VRVPAAVLVLCLGPALALGQSLGDAARRQADKRAGRAPTTAKTYTDADLQPEESETAAARPQDTPAATSPTPDRRPAVAPAPPAGEPATEDAARAQLDREAEQRKERELVWRRRALQARARVDAAQREHDAVCGPGVLVLTGG
jgi:hypothetical protein